MWIVFIVGVISIELNMQKICGMGLRSLSDASGTGDKDMHVQSTRAPRWCHYWVISPVHNVWKVSSTPDAVHYGLAGGVTDSQHTPFPAL